MKQDDFINKAMIVHNGKYSYEKVIYKNNSTKVLISCPIHGDFWQTPKNHIIGQGCPICGEEYAREHKKNDYRYFMNTALNKCGDGFSYPFIDK